MTKTYDMQNVSTGYDAVYKMVEVPCGEWVSVEDHRAEIERLQDRLAMQKGVIANHVETERRAAEPGVGGMQMVVNQTMWKILQERGEDMSQYLMNERLLGVQCAERGPYRCNRPTGHEGLHEASDGPDKVVAWHPSKSEPASREPGAFTCTCAINCVIHGAPSLKPEPHNSWCVCEACLTKRGQAESDLCNKLIYTQRCQKPKDHEDGCEWVA